MGSSPRLGEVGGGWSGAWRLLFSHKGGIMRDRIAFARALRREQTPAERAFWALLYPWRAQGMHWGGQAPIGPHLGHFCVIGRFRPPRRREWCVLAASSRVAAHRAR